AKQLDTHGKITEAAQVQIDNCLHICLQLSANLAILINPFLPNTARKMLYMMKVVEKMLDWENAGSVKLLSVGYSLRAPELLFRKIEDAEVQQQVDKLKKGMEDSKEQNTKVEATDSKQPESVKEEIVYDDFGKLDLRIGTITSAEKVAKADKLLKLQVDLGFEKRTIVSGIAQHFTPESLFDKQVIVVANLAPRKMRGIESQGMILTAEQPDGKLILVNPDSLTANGSTVR
ncbi:MAG: methionine--tRNA ligase subunit beta, partial [Flavisolibacter sp.]